MKTRKVLCGVVLGCSALLLAGCGNTTTQVEATIQTVTCTASETDDSVSYSYTYEFVYSKTDKAITSGKFITSFSYPVDYADVYGSLDYCSGYEDEEGVFTSCEYKTGENSVSTTIGLSLDKLESTTADSDEEEPFKKTFTAEEVKSWVEKAADEGITYTCTIK